MFTLQPTIATELKHPCKVPHFPTDKAEERRMKDEATQDEAPAEVAMQDVAMQDEAPAEVAAVAPDKGAAAAPAEAKCRAKPKEEETPAVPADHTSNKIHAHKRPLYRGSAHGGFQHHPDEPSSSSSPWMDDKGWSDSGWPDDKGWSDSMWRDSMWQADESKGWSNSRMTKDGVLMADNNPGACAQGGRKVRSLRRLTAVAAPLVSGWTRAGPAQQSQQLRLCLRLRLRLRLRPLPMSRFRLRLAGRVRKGGTSMEDLSRKMASSTSIFVCVINQFFIFDIGKCEL